jgi:hypothetical protein
VAAEGGGVRRLMGDRRRPRIVVLPAGRPAAHLHAVKGSPRMIDARDIAAAILRSGVLRDELADEAA